MLPASKDGRFDRRYVTETDGGVLWLAADRLNLAARASNPLAPAPDKERIVRPAHASHQYLL